MILNTGIEISVSVQTQFLVDTVEGKQPGNLHTISAAGAHSPNRYKVCFVFTAYPTHSHLHDGIEATLGRVQVSRNVLLAHQGVEPFAITGELKDVLVAKWAGAVLVAGAGVQQFGWGGADVRHNGLLHKRAKA